MFFSLSLGALCSNTVLAASLVQRSGRIRGLDTGPISSSDSLSPTVPAPTSNNNASSGNTLKIACNAQQYGKNLKVNSCRNVFRFMMKDETQYTFADRDSGLPFDVPLPWRTLSNDGLCFVQPVLKEGAISGHASPTQIGNAAFTILQICVVERGMGGMAFNIGGDNNINVAIADYIPKVRCDATSTPGPAWNSSVGVFANMRASKQVRVFGDPGEPNVQEQLPVVLEGSDRKAQLSIDIDGPATLASWYEIWEAVLAIGSMCARQKHKGGKAKGLGLGANIRLELSATTHDPDGTVANASTVSVMVAGNDPGLPEDLGAGSSPAGSMGFDRVAPSFELVTGVWQDNSSAVTLPDDSDE